VSYGFVSIMHENGSCGRRKVAAERPANTGCRHPRAVPFMVGVGSFSCVGYNYDSTAIIIIIIIIIIMSFVVPHDYELQQLAAYSMSNRNFCFCFLL